VKRAPAVEAGTTAPPGTRKSLGKWGAWLGDLQFGWSLCWIMDEYWMNLDDNG